MTFDGGPKIGVALGGGSARGLAHIPFIEAMDELGLKPALIAGTSIGALIGAGWANDMSGAALRAHASEVLGTIHSITGRIWTTHTRDMRRLFMQGLPMQFVPEDVVEAFLPDKFVKTFRELRTPLFVTATDFWAWNQVVFESGPLNPAIAASIAVPSFFRPLRFKGRLLVDGGVVNPLPLDIASAGADLVVGIDVNGEPLPHPPRHTPSPLDIAAGSGQIMAHQLTANLIAAYPPDVYVRPHLQTYQPHEFWRVREILAAGDREKERFKRHLADAVDAFIAGKRKNPVKAQRTRSR